MRSEYQEMLENRRTSAPDRALSAFFCMTDPEREEFAKTFNDIFSKVHPDATKWLLSKRELSTSLPSKL